MTTTNTTPVQTKTLEQMQAEIDALKAQNAELSKAKATGGMKITEKGGLSVYGLGRFPVSLYKSQWVKLIAMVPEITKFIEANGDKLTDKAKTADVAEDVKVA